MNSKLIPLVAQLGQYLKAGMDHYSDLRAAGKQAGPEIVAAFLYEKMGSWNPTLQSSELLDEDTKRAAARFLAGIAINFTGS